MEAKRNEKENIYKDDSICTKISISNITGGSYMNNFDNESDINNDISHKDKKDTESWIQREIFCRSAGVGVGILSSKIGSCIFSGIDRYVDECILKLPDNKTSSSNCSDNSKKNKILKGVCEISCGVFGYIATKEFASYLYDRTDYIFKQVLDKGLSKLGKTSDRIE